MEDEVKSKKSGKKVFKYTFNTVLVLIFLFVLFETVIGLLDMQRLDKNEDPLWYINSSTEVVDDKTITKYNLGLYVIHKEESSSEKKLFLTLFFVK